MAQAQGQPEAAAAVFPTRMVEISGSLPEEHMLKQPIMVLVDVDEGEVVVTEPRFFIHAAGPTEAAAIEAFKQRLVGYLHVLQRREGTLSSRLRAQLEYLRTVVRPA